VTTVHPKLQQLQTQFAESPLVHIQDDLFQDAGVELWIKRDDLLHPIISGNKWRKLKYILDHALTIGADTIVSMGGAHSNHLHALAFAGKALGLNTVAYVRGEQPSSLNPTLQDLLDWGMELRFISRGDYRRLRVYKAHDSLPELKSGQYWLPEGGATEPALKGVAEIVSEIDRDFDVLAAACGTGTTLAGLLQAAPAKTKVIGVAALKGAEFLHADVEQMISLSDLQQRDWSILLDYHFGGFAKKTPELLAFISAFHTKHRIPLEPIYTGKALYAVYDLLIKNHFRPGQSIVVIHTGGLQGIR